MTLHKHQDEATHNKELLQRVHKQEQIRNSSQLCAGRAVTMPIKAHSFKTPGVVEMEFGLKEEITAMVLAQQLISPRVRIRQDTRNETKEQLQHKRKIALALLHGVLIV